MELLNGLEMGIQFIFGKTHGCSTSIIQEKFRIWRVLRDLLSRKIALRRRYINVDATCPICGLYNETEKHVLYGCILDQDVCYLSIVGWQAINSLQSWITNLLQTVRKEKVQKAFMVIWNVWTNRNDVAS